MSSSLSQTSGFSRASLPDPNRPKPACSPQEATPVAGRTGFKGCALIVPGCGEEIIPFEGLLGVTREEYRVAPMANDGRRRNINLLPFRPQCALKTPRATRAPCGARTRGWRQSLSRFSPGAQDRLTLGQVLLPRKPTPLLTPRVSLG
jgi:hypothetical protein